MSARGHTESKTDSRSDAHGVVAHEEKGVRNIVQSEIEIDGDVDMEYDADDPEVVHVKESDMMRTESWRDVIASRNALILEGDKLTNDTQAREEWVMCDDVEVYVSRNALIMMRTEGQDSYDLVFEGLKIDDDSLNYRNKWRVKESQLGSFGCQQKRMQHCNNQGRVNMMNVQGCKGQDAFMGKMDIEVTRLYYWNLGGMETY